LQFCRKDGTAEDHVSRGLKFLTSFSLWNSGNVHFDGTVPYNEEMAKHLVFICKDVKLHYSKDNSMSLRYHAGVFSLNNIPLRAKISSLRRRRMDPTQIFKLVLYLSAYIARPDISLMLVVFIVEEAMHGKCHIHSLKLFVVYFGKYI
jgi:hypothetical protein